MFSEILEQDRRFMPNGWLYLYILLAVKEEKWVFQCW